MNPLYNTYMMDDFEEECQVASNPIK